MGQILFITKCIERERFLEGAFRQLGHKVFLSDQFLTLHIKRDTVASLTDFFKIIVLSETLTNQEVLLLLKSFKGQSLSIFREVERLPTKKEQQLWTERGINEWLVKDMMLEEIREMLDGYIDSSKERQIFTEEEENEKRSLSSLALNSTQLRFLQILYREHDQIISREKMCELLWERPGNASNLSQLSCLVKLLRKKLNDQGVEGESILTVWGQGYRLSDTFFKQITTEIKI
ncbi:winged helix-turn-helix domain-containing protein [Enterococcus avium]|uniref:winged helix-turn-helix domain-containing protein n=1 Tax=Enterococcus avium TaxID=33945 RepID=UPI0039A6ED0E